LFKGVGTPVIILLFSHYITSYHHKAYFLSIVSIATKLHPLLEFSLSLLHHPIHRRGGPRDEVVVSPLASPLGDDDDDSLLLSPFTPCGMGGSIPSSCDTVTVRITSALAWAARVPSTGSRFQDG